MNEIYKNYLEHHGILGQKHGVRNGPPYPLSAGAHSAAEKKAGWRKSLERASGAVEAGNARRKAERITRKLETSRKKANQHEPTEEEMLSYVKKQNIKKTYEKALRESAPKSKLESVKSVVDQTSDAVNRIKNIEKKAADSTPRKRFDLSKMTDQQLRDAINRESLELQYNRLFNDEPTISSGHKKIQNILENTGNVLAVGSSALGIALAIKQLRRG